MDENHYDNLLADAFNRVEALLDDVDPDEVEAVRAGDTVTLTFSDGTKLILTPQRPLHQIWVAARDQGYRFDYDEAAAQWMESSGKASDLFSLVAARCKQHANVVLALD